VDEFQDTCDLQWNILSNLAEETLQDGSGERSFFFVGDVKQAIYGWRGGNPRLFGMLLDRYGEVISTRELVESRRSAPGHRYGNAVFGDLPQNALLDGDCRCGDSGSNTVRRRTARHG
jgi:ATP-dependent helicase/nuclease subunit A